jgi:hypothetical protein
MDNYKTISTSPNSARLAAPIVIDESATTRKVLFADINDKKKAIGETVGITIVHQRRNPKNEWEDIETIPLSKLRGGEAIKLDLDSKTTKKIYDQLTKLYALVGEEGIQYGEQTFTVAKAEEIIKVSKDRKVLIERLLAENHADEVWEELVSLNPDLATRLSLARVQANRTTALEIFQHNLEENNSDEAFWQKFFATNDWIFGYGLNYQFLHLLKDQPDYGGKNYTGPGSQKGDFILTTSANARFTVLVEIKTPKTPLLSYEKKTPRKVINPRNDVWLLSSDLLGAISQIQVNSRTWSVDSQRAENVRDLEPKGIYTVEPKGILVIGNTKELQAAESIISCFESYRPNILNPEVITFDELFERAKFIVNVKSHRSLIKENQDEPDMPF